MDEFDEETYTKLMSAKKKALEKGKELLVGKEPLQLSRTEVYERKYYVRKERSLRIVDTFRSEQEIGPKNLLAETALFLVLFALGLYSILSMVGIHPLYALGLSLSLLVLGESPFVIIHSCGYRGYLFLVCYCVAEMICARCPRVEEVVYSQPVSTRLDGWIAVEDPSDTSVEVERDEGRELDVIRVV